MNVTDSTSGAVTCYVCSSGTPTKDSSGNVSSHAAGITRLHLRMLPDPPGNFLPALGCLSLFAEMPWHLLRKFLPWLSCLLPACLSCLRSNTVSTLWRLSGCLTLLAVQVTCPPVLSDCPAKYKKCG